MYNVNVRDFKQTGQSSGVLSKEVSAFRGVL